MARSFRSALVYAALLSTATAALVMGCADSTSSDFDGTTDAGSSADSGKKDGRAGDDGSTSDEDEDSGSNPKKDSGTKDSGGDEEDDDAGPDAGSDADADADADAGEIDAPDAGETDAGDSGADGGDDAGDSGSSTAMKPAQGDVVISEVMFNPSASPETEAEWIELYNTTAEPRLLSGLVLKDGANRTHTIRPGLVIAPGTYVVLASTVAGVTAANVPAGVVVYDYNTDADTQVQLANGTSGALFLLDGATEIARANYGPTTGNGGLGLSSADNGQSIQLKTLTYAAAGLKASWCYSANVWVAGSDKGTPGAASDCP